MFRFLHAAIQMASFLQVVQCQGWGLVSVCTAKLRFVITSIADGWKKVFLRLLNGHDEECARWMLFPIFWGETVAHCGRWQLIS
jgi:hypothetical protein